MRRTIVLLATVALTLLVASGVALAVTKIGSAGAQSSVVGPAESIQKAINRPIRATLSWSGEFTERTW